MRNLDPVQTRALQTSVRSVCRLAVCLATHPESRMGALQMFERAYRDDPHAGALRDVLTRAAVTTTTTAQAGDLIPEPMAAAVLQQAAAYSILDRLGATEAPPRTRVAVDTGDPADSFDWHEENEQKPVHAAATTAVTVRPATVAGLLVVSNELLEHAAIAEAWLMSRLPRGLGAAIDRRLVSILAGANPTDTAAASGDPIPDLLALLALYDGPLESASLIMSSRNAIALRLRHGDVLSDLTRSGGAAPLPILASRSAGDTVLLVDGRALVYAREGVAIDASRHASVMLTDDGEDNGTLVHCWQQNLTSIRCESAAGFEMTGSTATLPEVDWATLTT